MKLKKELKSWDLETKIAVIVTIPFLIVVCCVFLYALCYMHYLPVLTYNKYSGWEGIIRAVWLCFIIPIGDFSLFMMIKYMGQKDTEMVGMLILNQKEEK